MTYSVDFLLASVNVNPVVIISYQLSPQRIS